MKRFSTRFAPFILILSLFYSLETRAQYPTRGLEGVYNVQGMNPNGSSYSGTATIGRQGDKYVVYWRVGTSYQGIGTLRGSTFHVVYGNRRRPLGEVSYNLNANGSLSGPWHTYKSPGAIGSETLIPR